MPPAGNIWTRFRSRYHMPALILMHGENVKTTMPLPIMRMALVVTLLKSEYTPMRASNSPPNQALTCGFQAASM